MQGIVLESEIEKKMSEIQVLQRQIKGPDERITRDEGENCVIDLTEDVENDKVLELMIENKVLDCEKKKAENEVIFWKAKCESLELRITSLERDVGLESPGSYKKPIVKTETVQDKCFGVTTPLIDTTLHGKARQSEILHEKGQGYNSRTRKQLNFGEEETPDKTAPTTPVIGPIDICNSSDDDDEEGSSLGRRALRKAMKNIDQSKIEDDITHCYHVTQSLPTSKRKRGSHIVHSDSGSDDADDNVPLCRLRKSCSKSKESSKSKGQGIPKKYPRRNSKESKSKSNCGISTTGSLTEESESESLKRDVGLESPGSYKKPIVKTEFVQEECYGVTTPLIDTTLHGKGQGYNSRTRKQLNFEEGTPDITAPTTPAGGPIDICDSSDDDDEDKGCSLGQRALRKSMKNIDQSEIEDDITHCYQITRSLPASKRKRGSHIVHSDSGSDDADDNVPLRRLRKSCSKEASKSKGQNIPKKYPPRNSKESKSKNNCGIPTTTGSLTDDEIESGESESEGESLNGFIVSESEAESNFSIVDESSQGEESEKVDYGEIMSRIGRRKDHLIKWDFEADMLSAFGRNPELCMQAVCTLYRQQTSDEQMSKATIHQNERGFNQCDAPRGSRLGEFLTDGDPDGGLKKSVEELMEFQANGLELCRILANRYSKQLFAMYQNKEDPLWPVLCTNS